jgi:predicted acetyltransferase
VASQVVNAVVEKARERGEVVSALMPFRVSFYEHFGFGIVERQNVWTFPLAALPSEPAGHFRFGTPDDKAAMIACRLRQAQQGHCDVETSDRALDEWFEANADDSQLFVNEIDGQIRSYAWIHSRNESDQWTAVVTRPAWDSPEAFRMLLTLLGSFKDQYPAGRWVLPRDVPLNLLLKEHHVRGGDKHPHAATCRQQSRMQVRVLDHVKFLDGQKLSNSTHVRGSAVIAVEESEGSRNVFKIDIEGGHISAAASTASPDVVMKDFTWAPIACGDLRASTAASLGLLDVSNNGALAMLDALSIGPAPYCYEYF